MRFIIYTITFCFTLISCGQNDLKKKELELKEKELALREKELLLKQEKSEGRTKINNRILNEQKFELPLLNSINGFKYSKSGELTFHGKSFSPKVKATTEYVPLFKISMLPEKNIAGAIAMDQDGQNFLFLLDLNSMSATPLQPYESWNAAQEIFWSPSTKYMLALCAYEGQSFISIDLDTKAIKKMGSLKPGKNHETMWVVDNTPKWDGENDILVFNIAEYCNPYVADCNNEINKKIATFKVNLDASNLNIYRRN